MLGKGASISLGPDGLMGMTLRTWRLMAFLAMGSGLVACNMITGADDVEFSDEDDSGAGGADATSGAGADPTAGAGADPTAGAGADPTAGAGGASSSSGAGGDPSTSSASSSASTSASSGGGEMCGGSGPGTTPLDAEEQAFLAIINDYRQQNGLGTLTACTSLNRAAQGHSEDMRDNDYFSHTGLNNSTPWDRACDACYDLGCGPSTAMAENIAAGNSDAQATFTQWKNSPGHNANMLGANFTQIGIGRATGGGTYGVYWTNVFGGDSEPSCF
jgi:uncharacterized protein YkwD